MTDKLVQVASTVLRTIDEGEGPAVVLLHGFPEGLYSWRHQIGALAAAGFRAIAPDQRGYGSSSAPQLAQDYTMVHLVGDVVGLLDNEGIDRAVVVGHDWGAAVAWQVALMAPERCRAVACLSVPFAPRSKQEPRLPRYIRWFQDQGVADAEFGADPALSIRKLFYAISGDAPATSFGWVPDERGLLHQLIDPDPLPDWLTAADVDHYATAFAHSGFTGGLNWYRNIVRNWELSPHLDGARVTQSALFVAGERDPVIMGRDLEPMREWVTDLRDIVLIPGVGHWTQQEAPDEVNDALLGFLRGLE